MATQESATARLGRLLTMVPWLVNRQGIDIAEAAQELGVTTEQVEADLALLFVCGTPGHLPDDLIEAEWEQGRVFLRNADTIARPLRLGLDEALALIVGLRTLAEVPGLGERDAVIRALAKLEAATGESAAASQRIQVTVEDAAGDLLPPIRDAIDRGKRVHLRYLVAARDESTERDVDPLRLRLTDGRWYLEGWCHRAGAVRLFRLDRIEALQVLDVDADPPETATARELSADVFVPAPTDLSVVLDLAPQAAWVADYYPVESVQPHGEGTRVTLRTGDLTWLRRLMWRLGDAARVVEPDRLRHDVERGAREALAAYGPGTTAAAPAHPVD